MLYLSQDEDATPTILMITSILQLLRAMANDNKEVQNQLFAHLQTLLTVKQAPSTLAELLKEVQLPLVVHEMWRGLKMFSWLILTLERYPEFITTCKISLSRYFAKILNVVGE